MPPVWPAAAGPRARATALGSAAAAARAAGASAETVAALEKEAEGAQHAAASNRQLGARLDSHRAAVRRLAQQVEAAEDAVTAAAARLDASKRELAEARAALAQVEAEVAHPEASVASAGSPEKAVDAVLHDVQRLLEEIEKAPMPGVAGVGPCLPESVLGAIASLRGRLDAHVATPSLDAPLEQGAECSQDPPSAGLAEPAVPSEASADNLMEELADLADTDDEGLLDVARRLKKARRNGPY